MSNEINNDEIERKFYSITRTTLYDLNSGKRKQIKPSTQNKYGIYFDENEKKYKSHYLDMNKLKPNLTLQ